MPRVKESKVLNELGELAGQLNIQLPVAQLDQLLDFDGLACFSQPEKYARISAVLMLAASHEGGQGPEALMALKNYVLELPSAQVAGMLQDFQQHPEAVGATMGRLMEAAQVHAVLPGVELDDPTGQVLPVSASTMQNLQCAHAVNRAVKPVLVHGAGNQAPDVFRTSGRNLLLHENGADLRFAVVEGDGGGPDKRRVRQQQRDLRQWALALDNERREVTTLNLGEDMIMATDKSMDAAALGTGKCAEHAATSFSLLTDEASLQMMHADLPEGCVIILAHDERDDHNFVLLASPGAVAILERGDERRLRVLDERNVVVVDPWMPVPCAHTMDRASADISRSPTCQVVAVKEGGVLQMMDRRNARTAIPPRPTPMLVQIQETQQAFQKEVMDRALGDGLIPHDKRASLATVCGKGAMNSLMAGEAIKPPFYAQSHTSTLSPMDSYVCVAADGTPQGRPERFVTADPRSFDQVVESIMLATEADPIQVALDPARVAQMNDPALRANCTNLRQDLERRQVQLAAERQRKAAAGIRTGVLKAAHGPPDTSSVRHAPQMQADGAPRTSSRRPALSHPSTSSSSSFGKHS